jgi:hypothetical protein
MIREVTYSDATRCADCHGRALLTEAMAEALAVESLGRLQSFACRAGRGWHVWCPEIETRSRRHT